MMSENRGLQWLKSISESSAWMNQVKLGLTVRLARLAKKSFLY